MDPAKQQAIINCGECDQPEEAHWHRTGTDPEAIAVLSALGGACPRFVVSDAAVIVQKYLAITGNREPVRRPGGPLGKRLPLHGCGQRHRPGSCPFTSGTDDPDPEIGRRGAAAAREALGITPGNQPGARR